MRLENRSRRQKKKGPRQSTEWTQAEGEQEGGEGGLVNCTTATGLKQGEILPSCHSLYFFISYHSYDSAIFINDNPFHCSI